MRPQLNAAEIEKGNCVSFVDFVASMRPQLNAAEILNRMETALDVGTLQ